MPGNFIGLIKIGIMILGLIVSFIGGCKYNAGQELEAQLKLREDYENVLKAEIEQRNKISAEYEEKLSKAKGVTRTITREVTKEIEKPIYKECVLPETGTKQLNDAAIKYNQERGINSQQPPATSTAPETKSASVQPKPTAENSATAKKPIIRPISKDGK